jgi:GAF domain-containing protein
VEFFAAVNNMLLPNGVAILNIVADPLIDDPYSKAIDAGLRAIFKSCVSIPLTYADKAVNIIYVCQHNDQLNLADVVNHASGKYYTDDLNRATWDQQFLKME